MNFIESFLKDMIETFEQKPSIKKQLAGKSYLEKTKLCTRLMISNAEHYDESNPIYNTIEICALVGVFVPNISSEYTIRSCCLEPDADLVNALSHASPPTNLPDDYFNHHDETDNWFIQLPDKIFSLTDELALIGIFHTPASEMTTIICEKNGGERVFAVTIGSESRTFIGQAEVTRDEIKKAGDLARLVILHYDSKRKSGHEFIERDRYPSPIKNQKISKKVGRRNPKYSVFRHIKLDYRGDYKRQLPAEKGRRLLDHAFSVRGHFRWQACGRRWSDHKLVWIDSHQRGEGDLDVRPAKIKLEA